MPGVQWIKIATDIFGDEKIKIIGSMPKGDSLLVTWFRLLCLAGKLNSGGTFLLAEGIPYDEAMLATVFNQPESMVRKAMQTFQSFGMVTREDGVFSLVNWEKYQNLERMEEIREQTRKRVAKHRNKLRNAESNDRCNADVTLRNAIEEEEEKEEEKDSSSSSIEQGQKYLGGLLGQNIVRLTDDQFDDLAQKLTVDELDHYMAVIVECEQNGKHYAKSHYKAILEMAEKDRSVKA